MQQRQILLRGLGASHAAEFVDQVREIADKRIEGWETGQG